MAIETRDQAYWGKTSADGAYHRLSYHCLDVAATAQALLETLPDRRARLAVLLEMEAAELSVWVTFFAALHDLGKFSDSFQNLRPELLRHLQRRQSRRKYPRRHDTLGYLLWRRQIRPLLVSDEVIAAPRIRRPIEDGIDLWMQAVTGHHGQPPLVDDEPLPDDVFELPADAEAALSFLKSALTLITGGKQIPSFETDTVRRSSWWLAGITVLADWLGSNTEHFPYCDEIVALEDYWQSARKRAMSAVQAAGLVPGFPAPTFELSDCFAPPPEKLAATPAQILAGNLPLPGGPQLVILEDLTGSGKTETALLLAYRLMANGNANGLYLGLPTMATANAMYRRFDPIYRRLYTPESRPSLALAHGHAQFQKEFRLSLFTPAATREEDYGDGSPPATAQCNAWLADNRKKALLAEVGVGTIDQALLAILPARHQSLRLFGLLNKLLIVDEVHACDAYMQHLLGTLLIAHARAGGSAVLLSATLAHAQRQALVDAFAHGAGRQGMPCEHTGEQDYPLLTHSASGVITEQRLAVPEALHRHVAVTVHNDLEAVDAILANAIEQGHCVCWIRNTVGDAIASYEWLTKRHPNWDLELFHARFCLGDRLSIENRVLDRFGPESIPDQRHGQVLIATQVVEQSLDLDFDVMVSDLAPVDRLIQRAGRLHRHARDSKGRRIDGPDQRGEATLHLFTPAWSETPSPRWLRAGFPGTAAVYKNLDGQLWLGLKLLRGKMGFSMPADARRLIEGVYGENAIDAIPEGLQGRALAAEGDALAASSLAALKSLDLDRGYRAEGNWLDEDAAPTRLGEPTITLFLARWDGNRTEPWAASGTNAWPMSAVSVRRVLATGEGKYPDIDLEQWATYKEILPGKGCWGVLVPLSQIENGSGQGWVTDDRGTNRRVHYDPKTGLRIEPKEAKA